MNTMNTFIERNSVSVETQTGAVLLQVAEHYHCAILNEFTFALSRNSSLSGAMLRSRFETPRAGSGPTNPLAELFLASLSAVPFVMYVV
jgi:hypothetical protein